LGNEIVSNIDGVEEKGEGLWNGRREEPYLCNLPHTFRPEFPQEPVDEEGRHVQSVVMGVALGEYANTRG
jgi:hypothetical protein